MVPAFVLLVILQSFALAHRIRFMRGHAAELALHKEQLELEHAQEQARLIDAQRVELERSVVERTAELATRRQELEESNAELASTLEELRQSQRQLVQAEKLSTLGQLTFGIADQLHEPINAVAVGVKPLRRDSELVAVRTSRSGATVAVEISINGGPIAASGDPSHALDAAEDIVRDHVRTLERNGSTMRLTLPITAPFGTEQPLLGIA